MGSPTTFHGEIDRGRERQDWTTACGSMPSRDGKDQEQESLKQACLCWFARHNWLATSGANLNSPGVFDCRCNYVFPWHYVFLSFVLFHFHLFAGTLAIRPRLLVCTRELLQYTSLKNKSSSSVSDTFIKFVRYLVVPFGKTVQYLRSDQGTEYSRGPVIATSSIAICPE